MLMLNSISHACNLLACDARPFYVFNTISMTQTQDLLFVSGAC